MVDYLSCIPDPTGVYHDHQQELNAQRDTPVCEPLRLWRALNTSKINRVFIKSPLGENSMRVQLAKCNARLSSSLQIENPTGHSARKTFCSVSVNNNVNALVVAQATKHKDPRTLMGYVNPTDNSLMEASLAISSAANLVQYNGSHFAGVSSSATDDFSDNDENDPSSKRSNIDYPIKRTRISAECGNTLSSSSSSSSSCVSHSSPIMSSKEKSVLTECIQSVPVSHNSRPNVFKFYFGNK